MWVEAAGTWWRQRNRWERAALLAWVTVLAVVCARSAATPHRQNVLHIFTLAGDHWLAGQDLYGPVAADRDVFRYSPLAAASFAPWSLVPERLANVLWRLLNAAVFAAGVAWWLRAVVPATWHRTRLAWLFLLLLPLALPSLNNGQVNPLMVGLLLGSVAAVREERWTFAVVLLAAAFWLKVYPVALALLLIAAYPRALAGRYALAVLAGLLLPFGLQAPGYVAGQYGAWTHYLVMDDRELLALDYWLRDVRLLCRVCGAPLPEGAYPLVQFVTGAGAALLCYLAGRARWPVEDRLLLLTNLACCWMTVFGPSTESCTWVVLGPSLATGLLLAFTRPAARWERTLLVASYALLVATHMAKWFPWGNAVANLGVQALAGSLYCGCVVGPAIVRLVRARAVPEPGPLELSAA